MEGVWLHAPQTLLSQGLLPMPLATNADTEREVMDDMVGGAVAEAGEVPTHPLRVFRQYVCRLWARRVR